MSRKIINIVPSKKSINGIYSDIEQVGTDGSKTRVEMVNLPLENYDELRNADSIVINDVTIDGDDDTYNVELYKLKSTGGLVGVATETRFGGVMYLAAAEFTDDYAPNSICIIFYSTEW